MFLRTHFCSELLCVLVHFNTSPGHDHATHQLTVRSLCVNAETCSRSVAGRVEGRHRDAEVPLRHRHHQQRRHLCEVLNESVLQLLHRLVAQLVSKDTTSGNTEVKVLQRDILYHICLKL